MTISSRQRELAQYLWREGRLSRSDLCQRMGLSANSIGTLSAELIARGVICECEPEPSRGGRPRVPLEIDPTRCNAVGLSIDPGQISAVRVNLCGHRLGKTIQKEVDTPARMLTPIAGLLKQTVNDQTLGVGLSVTGFVDPASLCILQSSAAPTDGSVSLAAVRELVAPRPVIIENDMHAMAARWLLTHRADAGEDVLVVYIADGELGAALIVGGRPNRGCVTGGNELGHMRLPIETARCYCGHTGCLERICSSDFLLRHGAVPGTTLRESAAI